MSSSLPTYTQHVSAELTMAALPSAVPEHGSAPSPAWYRRRGAWARRSPCCAQSLYAAAPRGSWLVVPGRSCHTSFMDAGLLLNRVLDCLCCAGCGLVGASRQVCYPANAGSTRPWPCCPGGCAAGPILRMPRSGAAKSMAEHSGLGSWPRCLYTRVCCHDSSMRSRRDCAPEGAPPAAREA